MQTQIPAHAPFRSALGRHVFLDRYSQKHPEPEEGVQEGSLVVVHVEKNGHASSYIAHVQRIYREQGEIRLKVVPENDTHLLNDVPLREVDLPTETTPQQAWSRLADAAAVEETTAIRDDFYWALEDFRFVPGGRIYTGLGRVDGVQATCANCFVLGMVPDNRSGLFERLAQMGETLSRGGGVGLNFSGVRPRGCLIRGTNGRTSGAVSWSKPYSFISHDLIQQGGSRRGALMFVLKCWHPDILEFITVKQTPGQLVGANLSVGITDAFMAAVEADEEWQLVFPPTNHHAYDTEWNGDVVAWEAKGYPLNVHRTLPARQLWDLICSAAHGSGEPGLWFCDRVQANSNSAYYPEGEIIGMNPCGEQQLPAWSVCNLGHVNLSRFCLGWHKQFPGRLEDVVDLAGLKRTVQLGVRFLDSVIDLASYPLPEMEAQQLSERRIGLGTLGLAEMLVRAGLRYGSEQAVYTTRRLYKFIAEAAYRESIELAKEKGAFPFFGDAILERPFVKSLGSDIAAGIEKHGLRNVCLLTQAPTGSVGTMVGTSTGIEPYYSLEWERDGRMGKHKETAWIVDEYRRDHTIQNLPETFVTAQELTPEQHVAMQAAVQQWTDASVSKTVNCPADWTVAQVQALYRSMWDQGCKGGTIFRDGCRDEQVLTAVKPVPPLGPPPALAYEPGMRLEGQRPTNGANGKNGKRKSPPLMPAPKRAPAVRLKKDTPAGTAHIMGVTVDEEPFEVFVDIGKAGSDVKAMSEAIGRLCSLVLRIDSNVPRHVRAMLIAEQLRGIGGPRTAGFGPSQTRSVPDAVAQAIEELWLGQPQEEACGPSAKPGDLCPRCGVAAFVREGGCQHCTACGHSEC